MQNFTINENVPVEQHRTEQAVSYLRAFSGVLAHKVGTVATNVLNEWDLAVTDSKYGSNLRVQYHTKMRNDKIAQVARQYELV